MSRGLIELEQAINELNVPYAIPSFNSQDVLSVQLAIAKVEEQIDERTKPYISSKAIVDFGEKLKSAYCEKILANATQARNKTETNDMSDVTALSGALRRLENAVQDIQLIDH